MYEFPDGYQDAQNSYWLIVLDGNKKPVLQGKARRVL